MRANSTQVALHPMCMPCDQSTPLGLCRHSALLTSFVPEHYDQDLSYGASTLIAEATQTKSKRDTMHLGIARQFGLSLWQSWSWLRTWSDL